MKIFNLSFLLIAITINVLGNIDSTKFENSDTSRRVLKFEVFEYLSYSTNVQLLPTTPVLLKPWYLTSGFNFEAAKKWNKAKCKQEIGIRSAMFGKLYAFNSTMSRPLHADYTMAVYYKIAFRKIEKLSFEFVANHTSNGLTNINFESRSWNRIIVKGIYQPTNHLQLQLSGWIPFDIRDNVDVASQFGRCSMQVNYKYKLNYFEFKVTTNAELDNLKNLMSGGSFQFRFQKGFSNRNIRINAMFFHGKGQVLMDFDWEQTTFNVGLSINFNSETQN